MVENADKRFEKNQLQKYVEENFSIIRSCTDYESEYNECRSLKGRFHQYFIFGEFKDCSVLKKKIEECKKCRFYTEACYSLIQMEIEHKNKRIKDHLTNDIWKQRTSPPSDWNAELPEHFKEKSENSFRNIDEKSFCSIF